MNIESKAVSFLSNGLKLQGQLVYPLPKNTYYGVLFIHGGNPFSDTRHREFQEFLANNGYSSLQVFCRGIPPSEGQFQNSTLNNRLEDCKQALEFFKQTGVMDVNNIAVLGNSMGAHIAVKLTQKDKNIRVLLLHCPASYAVEAEGVSMNKLFTQIITQKNSWHSSLVWPILSKYKGMVQVVYGSKDDLIPEDIKSRYKIACANKGRYTVIKEGTHKLLVPNNKTEEKVRQKLFQVSLDFLNRSFF